MTGPIIDKPEIPAEYGNPKQRLEWEVVVEGKVEIENPSEEEASRLADASFAKYPQYGRLDPSMYMGGVSVLRPRRVIAWTSFTENATRFRFG
jgi:hypothetical protein